MLERNHRHLNEQQVNNFVIIWKDLMKKFADIDIEQISNTIELNFIGLCYVAIDFKILNFNQKLWNLFTKNVH